MGGVTPRIQQLNIMIKPASSLCDMACGYCFYCDEAKKREVASTGIMSEETASLVIERAFETGAAAVQFMFQGGEPTLAGIPFFVRFTERVRDRNDGGVRVGYALQTNGCALTRDFAQFFAREGFLLGLSLDGPKDIHDAMRVTREGKGTFARVMKSAALLAEEHVEFNILSVVTALSARHVDSVYAFYKKSGFRFLQYIPCLDPLDTAPFASRHSLTPAGYERFLKRLFDLWYADLARGEYTSIRYFDNVAQMAAGRGPELCGLSGECAGQLIVEADGTVYPCDFFCVDNWRLGNLRDASFVDMKTDETMGRFIESSRHNDPKCRSCRVYALCRGGCRRDRDHALDGVAGNHMYCEAIASFLEYAAPRFAEIARRMT